MNWMANQTNHSQISERKCYEKTLLRYYLVAQKFRSMGRPRRNRSAPRPTAAPKPAPPPSPPIEFQKSDNVAIYYLFLFVLCVCFTFFRERYMRKTFEADFESDRSVPLSEIIDSRLDFWFKSRRYLKKMYPIFASLSLFTIFFFLNCDLDFSLAFCYSVFLDTGFSEFLSSLHSHFLHCLILLLTILMWILLLHKKAFTQVWFAINAATVLCISLNCTLRIESLAFIPPYLAVLYMSVKKTNNMFKPVKKTRLIDVLKLVLLIAAIASPVVALIYYFVGLPKIRFLKHLSFDDVVDQYELEHYSYPLVFTEITSLILYLFFTFIKPIQYLNSYNKNIFKLLIISCVFLVCLPMLSGESALSTKIFGVKLMCILGTGILLGRLHHIYISYVHVFGLLLLSYFNLYQEQTCT